MGLISNGTTIFDNGAMASGFGGSMTFISSATASASSSIEFTLGDYKEYKFFFVNLNGNTDQQSIQFTLSTDNGSTYQTVAMTTTAFGAFHYENDSETDLAYFASLQAIQDGDNTDMTLSSRLGTDADQGGINGYMSFFNPSSNTYVKHFMARSSRVHDLDIAGDIYIAGYANTTSAITNIKFFPSTGNIDHGKILMFGVN
jgi:hypothetical protein